jgi:hypothetical protein
VLGVLVYLVGSEATPLCVLVAANGPAHLQIAIDRAQGRAVTAPFPSNMLVIGAWWGIGRAPGVSWEAMLPYAQPLIAAWGPYDHPYTGAPGTAADPAASGIYLYPDAWTIDEATGAVHQQPNPILPDPVPGY